MVKNWKEQAQPPGTEVTPEAKIPNKSGHRWTKQSNSSGKEDKTKADAFSATNL
jgi:hypothetical protein